MRQTVWKQSPDVPLLNLPKSSRETRQRPGGVFEKLNYILSLICVFLCMFLYMNYIYAYMYVCIGMNICVSCMYTGCIYVYIHRVTHAHVYTCMLYMCNICTRVLHAC